jgi:ATP-dependent DNA ligase
MLGLLLRHYSRNAKLEKLLARTQGMRFSEHLHEDGETIFQHACKGLEGIVSKRRDFCHTRSAG